MYLRKMARVVCTCMAAILLAGNFATPALASVAAKVCSSTAKVYRSASSSAASQKVPKNLSVSITGMSGSWAKVSYKGSSAYMPLKSLSPTSKTKKYASKSVTVYNSSGKKQGSLSKGASVYQLGTLNGMCCVMSGSGSIGFVKSGTLSSKKPSSTNNVSNVQETQIVTKIDRAISVAKSLLGRKYAISDNPPYSFNCSSFVQYCMGKAGYSMKGTAATQASDTRYTLIASVSSLKKGDVLFFATSGGDKVDHSAIYLGGGKFIEASRNAGKVQTNTLTSWYKSHFICARRP